MRLSRDSAFLGLVAALLLSGVLPTSLAAQTPTATDLVTVAGFYVERFVETFVDVVAQERIEQASVAAPLSTAGRFRATRRRSQTLVSDFLLVREPGGDGYMTFRDVLEVEGEPVPDREARVTELFGKPFRDAVAQAREIESHGARFNLPDLGSMSDPLMVLSFLQARYASRFIWTLDRRDPGVGPDVWRVDFEEREMLTSPEAVPGTVVPAHGTVWIAASSGSVRQTEVRVDAPRASHRVLVRFRDDEQFDVAVPFEMEEQHQVESRQATAKTTYGRFRRFRVDTDEQIPDVVAP